jgi:hypothetical protein
MGQKGTKNHDSRFRDKCPETYRHRSAHFERTEVLSYYVAAGERRLNFLMDKKPYAAATIVSCIRVIASWV